MDTRKISFDILKRIETENAYVGEVLDSALRTMQFSDKRDRAFITRLVEGVIERKLSLDFLIEKMSKQKNGGSKTGNKKSKNINIVIILRMGIYQIKYMDFVPDRAAISEMVELTKELGFEGLSGYVNAVLRNISRLKDDNKLDSYLVSKMDVRYSTPEWLCKFLVDTYGKETAKEILEDQYRDHDTVVRINQLKTDKEELRRSFEQSGIKVKDGILSDRCLRISGYDSVRRLPGYKTGTFVIQDETSVYTVENIGIKPGDKVLDMCAAPGGKSLLAYELSADDKAIGTIVSRDVSESKLEKIQENSERLGVPVRIIADEDDINSLEERYQPGINLQLSDATELDGDIISLPEDERFDIVISDVPCSGLGIIGRKNDIKYHMSPEIMEELSRQGLDILKNAAQYVKKGGRICFSTCTINPAENGDVVRKFLDSCQGTKQSFEIIEEKTFLQGIDGSDGFYFCIMKSC